MKAIKFATILIALTIQSCNAATSNVTSTSTNIPASQTLTTTFTPEPTLVPMETVPPTFTTTPDGPPKVYKDFIGIDGISYKLEIISPYPTLPLKKGLSVDVVDENDISKKYFEHAPTLAFRNIEDAVIYMKKVKGILPVTDDQVNTIALDPNFGSSVRAIHSYKYDYILEFGDYDVLYSDGIIRKSRMSFNNITDINGNSYLMAGFWSDNPEIDDKKDMDGYTTQPLKEKMASFLIPTANTDSSTLLTQLKNALKQ